nr:MAG TPA: hypothetical protein [Caudoviricetes sp.]
MKGILILMGVVLLTAFVGMNVVAAAGWLSGWLFGS